MDRGNFTMFAKGRQTSTRALGFIGYKDADPWSVCSTVFTSLNIVTKDADVYLVLLKYFDVVSRTLLTAQAVLPESERLRWSRGSVLDFGTQVRGFEPGRSSRIFQGEKKNPSEGK